MDWPQAIVSSVAVLSTAFIVAVWIASRNRK